MGEGKEKHSDIMILPSIPSNDEYGTDPEVRHCTHHNLTGGLGLAHGLKPVLISMQVWDLIVVGAGVAGAALAYRQGQVRKPSAPAGVIGQARAAARLPDTVSNPVYISSRTSSRQACQLLVLGYTNNSSSSSSVSSTHKPHVSF
jgi:hypothetical protein